MDTPTQDTTRLDSAALALPLTGARLDGIETLGGLLEEPSLLVFLRHGG